MKLFSKYILPALYGLLIYFTVRLLHDLAVDSRFWQRDWALNVFELSCSVLFGYASVNLFRWLFGFYDRRWPLQLKYERVLRELLVLISLNLAVDCVILIPMAAVSDDGLSWGDVADLTTIPTLYAIIYYGIARSRAWLKAYVFNQTQLEKITSENLQTELKFLKAQYHPHFLFNALNAIYFQIDDDVPGAKKSIEKFSDLLRYQLYDQQHQVAVSQEIRYLQSFIELQKIRSNDQLELQVFFDPHLNEQLVYPLLFLPFVENAFKFVGGDYQLFVSVRLLDNFIVLNVENSVSLTRKEVNKAGGIGLENLKRRLDLLYHGRHQLTIEDEGNYFKAELKIGYER